METLLFFKLPLLAATAWGINLTMTPPNPPPSPEERVEIERTTLETKYIPWFTTWLPWLGKVSRTIHYNLLRSLILFTVFEGATILGMLKPKSPPFLTSISVTTCLMTVAGALIRRSCYRHLSKFFTFDLVVKPDHRLVTSGPYSIVRHPSYTGAMLAGVGAFIFLVGSRGAWLVESSGLFSESLKRLLGPGIEGNDLITVGSIHHLISFAVLAVFLGGLGLLILVPRAIKEDEMMKRTFGKEWENWRAKVKWRLIPGIW